MPRRLKEKKKPTPENLVKAALKQEASYLGVYIFSIIGGLGQLPGIPDFLGCHEGRFLGIEAKAGKNVLSKHQEARRDEIVASGGLFIEYRKPGDLAEALGKKFNLF